jgi:hypothetical protein
MASSFGGLNTQDDENFSYLEYTGGDTQASQYDYNDIDSTLSSQQTSAYHDGSQSQFVEPDLSSVGVDELDSFRDLSILEKELPGHACRQVDQPFY